VWSGNNRVPSSRRLEREGQRNVEMIWLTGRPAPDFKTIADFRRDNGAVIRNVCRRFVELCGGLKLLSGDMVAIDGGNFQAVNSRDRNYTTGTIDTHQQQIEEIVLRYLDAIETADRTSPTGFDVKPADSTSGCNTLETARAVGVSQTKQRRRIYYSEKRALMWERWQKGESLQGIARDMSSKHAALAGHVRRLCSR
jgi:hypothetical protein